MIMSKYKGQVKGFPKQVVKKMLEYQEDQGNERDIGVFVDNRTAGFSIGGFDWDDSPENVYFWESVIAKKNFDVFFAKYPKEKKRETKADDYPKIMIVADNEEELDVCDRKRVVFAKKKGLYIAWLYATTLEQAENTIEVCTWGFAKEVPEEVALTKQEIADKFNIDINLLKIKE